MEWVVEFGVEFEAEFDCWDEAVQDALYAREALLAAKGPALGRPYADTLKGSLYPNMKELRFEVEEGVWRVAFAFDPRRRAVLLVGGNKAGKRDRQEKKFYEELIRDADARYVQHLERLKVRG